MKKLLEKREMQGVVEKMKRKAKHIWWIILIIAVLAGALLGSTASPARTQAAATGTPSATTSVAAAELVTADISATGTLRTSQTASLTWNAPGVISSVLVSKGETVEKNQILAELDPTSNLTWASLQADLLAAQENLVSLQDLALEQATTYAALVKAQIAAADAQASLNALYALPTQAAIDAWKTVYLKDQLKVTQAQENYDYWVAYEYLPHCQAAQLPGGRPGDAPGGSGEALCNSLSEADLRIQQANALSALSTAQQTEKHDLAYLTYLQNYQPDPTLLAQAETDLAVAQQQLVVAQAKYDDVKDGPDPAKVASAQAAIASIQAELDQRYLRAPFAGTVTDLAMITGDQVGAGAYAVRTDNMTSLFIDMQVSEVDINLVSLGQAVELMFDAVPDRTYSAVVANINPIGTVSVGVSTFTVTAVLSDFDSAFKPGMTAGASILTNQ